MNIRDLLKPGDKVVTGICWYSAEQWPRLREVAADAGELEETHEEWLTMMKRSLRSFREAGISYQLVDIDVEELVSWCKRKPCFHPPRVSRADPAPPDPGVVIPTNLR